MRPHILKRRCPHCGSDKIDTERRPNGDSYCRECDHKALTYFFDSHETVKEEPRKEAWFLDDKFVSEKPENGDPIRFVELKEDEFVTNKKEYAILLETQPPLEPGWFLVSTQMIRQTYKGNYVNEVLDFFTVRQKG